MIATNISAEGCSVLTIMSNGERVRKAYANTKIGRNAFANECSETENFEKVFEIWGNDPMEYEELEMQEREKNTVTEQIKNLEAKVDYVMIDQAAALALLGVESEVET